MLRLGAPLFPLSFPITRFKFSLCMPHLPLSSFHSRGPNGDGEEEGVGKGKMGGGDGKEERGIRGRQKENLKHVIGKPSGKERRRRPLGAGPPLPSAFRLPPSAWGAAEKWENFYKNRRLWVVRLYIDASPGWSGRCRPCRSYPARPDNVIWAGVM